MNISEAEKSFLRAIEQEDESTIRNLINLNDELRKKYKNTYKGYKLLKETMQKNLLKSTSILIKEGCPINAVNKNTTLHIAVKFNWFQLVLTMIKKGFEVNIPDENEDYPIHIATNHEYYNLAVLLIQNRARIDVRDGNNETPLIRAIKLRNVKLIKLFVKFDADMNNLWPNTNETLFYYLTIKNPIPNYSPPYKKMKMEIISNIAVNYFIHSNIKIQNIHVCSKDFIEFIIEKNLYDLLLRFNLSKMDLPFLKYTAIIHNQLNILDILMTYNDIDNDSNINHPKYNAVENDVYNLFRAAFETSNKEAYDVLENYRYFIRDNKQIYDYFFYHIYKSYTPSAKKLIINKKTKDLYDTIKKDGLSWLKICFKRRFLNLEDVEI